MPELKDYLISSHEHNQMCQRYEENQMEVINSNMATPSKKFNETKLVWYPIEIIEQYIQYVKSAVDAKSGKKVSAIGIYLTAHEDIGAEDPATPRVYSRRMSVNLVPMIDKLTAEEQEESAGSEYSVLKHKPVIIGRRITEEGLNEEKLHIINNRSEFGNIENIDMILERGHNFPPPPSNG